MWTPLRPRTNYNDRGKIIIQLTGSSILLALDYSLELDDNLSRPGS
jgi:hypothetical protein